MGKHSGRIPLLFSDITQYLSYCPETGEFRWIRDPGYQRVTGNIAGYADSKGYIYIRFARKDWAAHRLAWWFTNGCFPEVLVDHINGDPSDNRICNLRAADYSQNSANMRPRRAGGLPKGVCKERRRYRARITFRGVKTNLGSFPTAEEAQAAYAAASAQIHGSFGRVS